MAAAAGGTSFRRNTTAFNITHRWKIPECSILNRYLIIMSVLHLHGNDFKANQHDDQRLSNVVFTFHSNIFVRMGKLYVTPLHLHIAHMRAHVGSFYWERLSKRPALQTSYPRHGFPCSTFVTCFYFNFYFNPPPPPFPS